MGLLKKDQVLAFKLSPEIQTFLSKTLAGEVSFKRMTAAGNYAIESYTTIFNDDGSYERNFTHLKAAMVAFSMVDGDGNLFWEQGDIKGALTEFSQEVIDELFNFATEVNPALPGKNNEKEDAEDLEKNQEGSSSTD